MVVRSSRSRVWTRVRKCKPRLFAFVLFSLAAISAVILLPAQAEKTRLQSIQDETDPAPARRLNRTLQHKPRELYNGREVAASQVLVKFQDVTTDARLDEIGQLLDLEPYEGVGGTGVRLLQSRSKNTVKLLAALAKHPDVVYAEPNYIYYLDATPDDPSFGSLYGLQNSSTSSGGISAISAWDVSTGSPDVVVGIVDGGVDYNHPDLVGNMWSAPAAFSVTIGGQTINCEAGTHGFNAVTNTCNPTYDNYHATHIAGTIGAVGNNGIGVTGVN